MDYSIKATLDKYINEEKDTFHRFNSWQHCYGFFSKEYFKDKADSDIAALHLGFYLASWGMYRGSSFILQNDYKIHKSVVEILKKYSNVDFDSFENIQKVSKEISEYYNKNAHKNSKNNSISSNTLITKILLGTFACVPAYDRFFINGLKKTNIDIPLKFNQESFCALNLFYNKNKKDFKEFENTYPKMKLLDMYFWGVGFKE